ncbi:hypothetical protein [Syntrophotalea carbinolica]|uniref:hypothetical protein n=1 Tax=Syntrophotalea carbinolica TaxID=19 RepID=UPI000300DB59|nr:hypothetical protein [Syntrophotalea carbinolica]
MPALGFKGKQFVYSHHQSAPFRELKMDADKSFPVTSREPLLDDGRIMEGSWAQELAKTGLV